MMGARRPLAVLFVVLGSLGAVLGVLLVRVDQAVFTRSTVANEVDRVLADPDINRLLVRTITNRVVDASGQDDQRAAVEQTVTAQVESPATQKALRATVLGAYDVLTTGDASTIDISLAERGAALRKELVALDPALDAQLPPADELVRFTLFPRDVLPWGYRAVDNSRSGSWTLLIVGLVLVGVALILGPGRFSLISLAGLVASIAMLVVWLLITFGIDRVIGGIDDALARRVSRLAADRVFGGVERLSLGVAIAAGVVCIAGALFTMIRNKYFPPKPKVVLQPGTPPR